MHQTKDSVNRFSFQSKFLAIGRLQHGRRVPARNPDCHPKLIFFRPFAVARGVRRIECAALPTRTNMLKSGYDAVLHPISSVSMLLKHKDAPGAAAPFTVQVVVTLSGRGPESVTLTVETVQ